MSFRKISHHFVGHHVEFEAESLNQSIVVSYFILDQLILDQSIASRLATLIYSGSIDPWSASSKLTNHSDFAWVLRKNRSLYAYGPWTVTGMLAVAGPYDSIKQISTE